MRFEYRFEREQGEIAVLVICVGLGVVGELLHASSLVLFGAVGALSAAVLLVWQRRCLHRLAYARRLPVARALFGEEIVIECELVNDKFLPLPWVRVTDEIPSGLSIPGASRHPDQPERALLIRDFAMLPFQRTRRHTTIVCDRRGRHVFGSSQVTSGDPLGIQQRSETVPGEQILLVYPKLFSLFPPNLVSQLPLGDERTARRLLEDPSRVAGMRAYRPGDPMRHVDWRASARSGELLVRDFEPTTTLSLSVFIDDLDDGSDGEIERREFTIALGASLLAHFAGRGCSTGLFAPGSAGGEPVVYEPTSTPEALTSMLELLALCEPDRTASLASMMAAEAGRLRHGSTVVVVSSNYAPPLIAAIAAARRRTPVLAIVVDGPATIHPPPGTVDAAYTAHYVPEWRHQDDVVLIA